MRVVFDHAEDEAADIKTFFFRSHKPVEYEAGQFIELTMSGGDKHWFTLSSAPEDELLSITTRRSTSAFKQALWALQPGETVPMAAPMGDFVLPKDTARPLIFVAAGLGITPFHSICRHLANTHEDRPIRFFYAVSLERDIIFLDTFDKLGLHVTIFVTEPTAAWGGERGHITAEQIIELSQPTAESLIYVAGPEPMVEQLRKDLITKKIASEQIVGDYFPGYQPV